MNYIKKSWCCEHCSKPISQGEERKNCQYILSPQSSFVDTSGWENRVNYPRIERIKMYLYCPPCSQGIEEVNQKLLDRKNPQHAILYPGVSLEKSAIVKEFDNELSRQSLGEVLEEDWDKHLKGK